MGFDLKPRNKKLGWFHFGAFSWSWMIDAGVGLLLSTGASKDPAQFSYQPDKKRRCPRYNDGYYVSADLAWSMGVAAIGLASVQKHIGREWKKLSQEDKNEQLEWNKHDKLYKEPVRKDFIETVEKFGVWAQKSSGFGIF